jgi:hypothetical protein
MALTPIKNKPLENFNVFAFPPIRKKPRMDGAPSFIHFVSVIPVGIDKKQVCKLLIKTEVEVCARAFSLLLLTFVPYPFPPSSIRSCEHSSIARSETWT